MSGTSTPSRRLSSTTSDHPKGSKIQLDSLGWQGHGHSNCLPSAVAAHPFDLAVRNLSPRARRCETQRRRRPFRLAAFLVRKSLCPSCGIRSVLYFGSFAPSAVTRVEPHASPHAIHFADSDNASLVSAAIPTPPRRQSFFRFFSRAPSSPFLLQALSAVFFLCMLLQRRDPGLLLRTIFAPAFLLWLL